MRVAVRVHAAAESRAAAIDAEAGAGAGVVVLHRPRGVDLVLHLAGVREPRQQGLPPLEGAQRLLVIEAEILVAQDDRVVAVALLDPHDRLRARQRLRLRVDGAPPPQPRRKRLSRPLPPARPVEPAHAVERGVVGAHGLRQQHEAHLAPSAESAVEGVRAQDLWRRALEEQRLVQVPVLVVKVRELLPVEGVVGREPVVLPLAPPELPPPLLLRVDRVLPRRAVQPAQRGDGVRLAQQRVHGRGARVRVAQQEQVARGLTRAAAIGRRGAGVVVARAQLLLGDGAPARRAGRCWAALLGRRRLGGEEIGGHDGRACGDDRAVEATPHAHDATVVVDDRHAVIFQMADEVAAWPPDQGAVQDGSGAHHTGQGKAGYAARHHRAIIIPQPDDLATAVGDQAVGAQRADGRPVFPFERAAVHCGVRRDHGLQVPGQLRGRADLGPACGRQLLLHAVRRRGRRRWGRRRCGRRRRRLQRRC